MREDELPAISAVQRLRLKPDDALVVSCPDRITEKDAEYLKDLLNTRLGISRDRIVALGNGITVSVIEVQPRNVVLNEKLLRGIIKGVERGLRERDRPKRYPDAPDTRR